MGWYDRFARWLAAQGFLVVGNDHLGHGLSVAGEENRGFFAQPNGNGCVLQDIHTLRTLTQKDHPQLPYFILGHSMGSFLTRQYIQRHGQGLAGAIIMGTGSQSALTLLAARTIARLSACARGWKSRSALLDKLTTGGFNRRFQPVKTGCEWITSDEEIAASYGRDPLRCFRCTVNAYDNMFVSIGEAQSARRMKGIPKSLPLLLISGECDPVGGFGKGVRAAYARYRAAGLQQVRCLLYPGCRHELLNEVNRETVYADLLDWMNAHMAAGQNG